MTKLTEDIHLRFTETEKQDIVKMAEETNMKITEFCRNAIFNHIRRIENPELFKVKSSINSADLNEIISEVKETSDISNRILAKTNLMEIIDKKLDIIHKYIVGPSISTNRDLITDLFKTHKTLSLKQIIEKLDLDPELTTDLVKIMHKEGTLKTNSRGRYYK